MGESETGKGTGKARREVSRTVKGSILVETGLRGAESGQAIHP